VNKKSRGLGNLQITQQIATEDRVLIYFLAREKWSSYFREIQRGTTISPLPLKKALERLVKKGKLLVISGSVVYQRVTRRVRNQRRIPKVRYWLPTKQYWISNPENIERVNAIKKKREDRIKQNQKTRKANLKYIQQRKKNRLLKHRWSDPFYVRNVIAKALVRIEYLDEKGVLDEIEITEKTFESWIKRSPRLQTIRKLLHQYKIKKKDLPFEKINGEYKIPEFAIWMKRELLYPKITKKKYYQWFRHLHTKKK